MRSMITATMLPFALMMATAPLESQGKGSDKGRGPDRSSEKGGGQGQSKAAARDDRAVSKGASDNRGQGKSERAQARPDNRGKGSEKAQAQSDNKGRGKAAARDESQRGGGGDPGSRGAASDFGRQRAANVRESGGDVEGRARPGRSMFMRTFDANGAHPAVRGFAVSRKMSERIAGRAVAQAFDRGVDDDRLIIRPADDRVRILNRDGVLLMDLDEARARTMGAWRVVTLRDDDGKDREGNPAFCRSGAGHPVWGRQWCIDKGFGIGADNDVRWGRAIDLEDVVIRRRIDATDLTRDVLLGVLGDVVFNRLAAHALTLGLVDPLAGRWMVEPTGRRVLLVNSGTAPVAEIVDLNGDNRADLMLVPLRPW